MKLHWRLIQVRVLSSCLKLYLFLFNYFFINSVCYKMSSWPSLRLYSLSSVQVPSTLNIELSTNLRESSLWQDSLKGQDNYCSTVNTVLHTTWKTVKYLMLGPSCNYCKTSIQFGPDFSLYVGVASLFSFQVCSCAQYIFL